MTSPRDAAPAPGYTAVRSGEVSTIPEALPWAHFQEHG